MLRFEKAARRKGLRRIAGTDEAGRGALAGPVVAAAVILPAEFRLEGLTDSKKLAPARRRRFFDELRRIPGVEFAVIAIPPAEIDRTDILRASEQAMRRAVSRFSPPPDLVLVDGRPLRDFPWKQRALVGGDGRSWSIAAASVLAKVVRDRLMEQRALHYPGYGFERNRGYGTAEHLEALRRLGPSPIHRLSFEPVRIAAGLGQLDLPGI